jgi:hypothetical protein
LPQPSGPSKTPTDEPITQNDSQLPTSPQIAATSPLVNVAHDPVTQDYSFLPTSRENLPLDPDAPIDPITQDYSLLLTSRENLPPAKPLNPRQALAMDMMLLGKTDAAISRKLNIARKTLYNWRTKDPHFRDAFQARREDLLGDSISHLTGSIHDALDTLFAQTKHPHPKISHRAAHSLIALSRIGYHLAPTPKRY